MGGFRTSRRRLLLVATFVTVTVVQAALPAVASSRDSDEWSPASSRQPTYSPHQTLGHLVGMIRVPAIGLEEEIQAGVDMSVINQGVAHWVGTAVPGSKGNVVLAGHRTTYSKPFEDLDKLAVGDLVYLTNGSGFEVLYRVSDTFIVAPTDMWITYENGKPMVTMFACHPKGSARYRIVVQAELVAGRLIA